MITPSTLATYAAEGYESEYRLEVDQRLDQMEFMLGRVKGLLIRSSASDFAADLQYNAYLDRAPHLREAAYQEEIRGYKVQLQKSMPFYMCVFQAIADGISG